MTHVTTTSGSETDAHALPDIHASLAPKNLLPVLHEVDAGYGDAELLVSSQHHYGVDLVGPPGEDHRWQAREHTGYALADFPTIGSSTRPSVLKVASGAVGPWRKHVSTT